MDQTARQECLSKVDENQKSLSHWAMHAPRNFQHKHDLVEAERARVEGDTLQAISLYDKAIRGARENHYRHEEALGNELAARFWKSCGREGYAADHMAAAYRKYLAWGAAHKARDLAAKYPQWLRWSEAEDGKVSRGVTTSDPDTGAKPVAGPPDRLDLSTVIKASQAISAEITLKGLLATMTRIMMENAGAQRGFLILYGDEGARIEASVSVERGDSELAEPVPIEDTDALSVAIVRYVNRSGESVVLRDAAREGLFVEDSYVKEKRPKSVLCTPLRREGRMVGSLYLENNLVANAFTQDRIELLNVLLSQAAISLENARLYGETNALNEQLIRQIEERQQAQEALVRSEEKYRTLLVSLPQRIFQKDRDSKYVSCNENYAVDLGIGPDEIVGKTDFDFYPRELAEKYRADDQLVMNSGQTGDIEESCILDGQESFVQTVKTPLTDDAGNVTGILGIFWDITQRKQVEAERERLIVRLEQQNAELERFAYTVSHDLRAPLISISWLIGALKEDLKAGDGDRIQYDTEGIANSANTMAKLLDDVLELSRIGRVVNEPEAFSLRTLVDEIVRMLSDQISTAGIQVVIASDLPTLFADRTRILEVLQNLMENAIKYKGDQSEPRIELGARQEGDETICYVRDNGIGIDRAYQEKVFGLFDQLDQKVEGSGVGLALAKRIVEAHGGRIWCESEGQGKGSVFFFAIPVESRNATKVT